jgi:hypothetical protein
LRLASASPDLPSRSIIRWLTVLSPLPRCAWWIIPLNSPFYRVAPFLRVVVRDHEKKTITTTTRPPPCSSLSLSPPRHTFRIETFHAFCVQLLTMSSAPGSPPPQPLRAPPASPDSKLSASSTPVPYANGVSPTPPAKDILPKASSSGNIVRRKLTGYVGFANLPNQWHRKSVRKGFNFNVMVVGNNLPPS